MQFVTNSESFVVGGNKYGSDTIILFTEHHWPGMVGEDYQTTEARIIAGDFVKEIGYAEAKNYYNSFKDCKDLRISFWRWVKSMSPEAVSEESERSTQQAISKVI
jgi:hypothetical protein